MLPENFQSVAPSEADAQLARESSHRFATHKLGPRSNVRIQVPGDANDAETALVPAFPARRDCSCTC